MKSDVQIEIYSVEKLRGTLLTKEFWFQNVAPITKHRAQFIINSPRSNSEDPVLFIAKVSDKIVGYRLIFPDTIYLGDDPIRLGWGSCFWVDESVRGKGVGKLLFQKSLELWNGNIGSLSQSKDAARVYEGDSAFYCFRESPGYQFITKLDTRFWIGKKVKFARSLGLLFKIIDFPVNGILSIFQYLWTIRIETTGHNQLEYYREILDEESIQFVNERNRKNLSRRGVSELNAIVRFPTSLATPFPDLVKSRYYFSTNADRFDYFYFKLYDVNRNLIALALINVEGRELRLPYYFATDNSLEILFNVVLMHVIKLKVEIITSYDERFNKFIIESSGFPTLLNRKQVRKSFLPVKYCNQIKDEFLIFDGDGA